MQKIITITIAALFTLACDPLPAEGLDTSPLREGADEDWACRDAYYCARECMSPVFYGDGAVTAALGDVHACVDACTVGDDGRFETFWTVANSVCGPEIPGQVVPDGQHRECLLDEWYDLDGPLDDCLAD